MNTTATMTTTPASVAFENPVDPRLKISALWIAMLFIFAYVDIFSLYRPDVIEDLQNGKVFVFDVSQTFLFFTTLFIVLPSLMVFFTLVMAPRLNRVVNIVMAAVYAFISVGSAVGEWTYYVFGSILEGLLLCGVIFYARTLVPSALTASPQPAS